MSKRQDILTVMRTRLAGILKDSGFQTDAGALVFVGQVPALSDNDPEQARALVVGEDSPGYQGEHAVIRLPLMVHAIVKADVDDPAVAAEAVIADIKKAVETDHDLGGLLLARGLERGVTTAAYREQGSEYVAGSVEYRAVFKELWGAP